MRYHYFLLSFILLLFTFSLNAQIRDKFSAKETKDDFQYLYETLKSSHYNLFVNTPKRKFDHKFHEIYSSINDSLNSLQINRLFQPFVALSKLGHCVTGYPFKSYNEYMARAGKIFPFDVQINNDHVFITANYSTDTTIQKGDEIIAFYGVNSKKWLSKMYDYLSGENLKFKNTLIDLIGFPRLYWMVYDSSKVFSLQIKKKSGEIVFINNDGILASDYKKVLQTKPSLFNNSRSLTFLGNIAYLVPGIFLNQESDQDISKNKSFDKGEFQLFIDSAFQQIHNKKSNDLIIDLRKNPGGDNTFSDLMISYFANQPFSFCSKFYIKTSAVTKEFWKNNNDTSLTGLKNKILTKKNGEIFLYQIKKYPHRTDSLRFNGKVYVLVNLYSYSNATTTAALIQDYKFGILVGEQTAESPTLYAAAQEFTLPNTKISVTYPKAFIIRPNGNKKLKGVEPDININDKITDSNDAILNWTLNQIKDSKYK